MIILKTKRALGVILLLAVCSFTLGTFDASAADVAVRQMDQTIDDMDKATQEQVDWADDVDKKLDITIKVLSVIQEEVKEEKMQQEASLKKTGQDKDAELGSNIGRWAAKINRIWRKLQEAAKEEGAEPNASSDKDLIDDKEISAKLGKAIDMMSSIKAELDKAAEEEKAKP